MSMTEAVPTPKPKRKRQRRKLYGRSPALVALRAESRAPSEFAGLTVTECCKACGTAGCVISGAAYCAHPRKGGLQASDLGNPEKLKRLQQAQKLLGKKDVDKRFG